MNSISVTHYQCRSLIVDPNGPLMKCDDPKVLPKVKGTFDHCVMTRYLLCEYYYESRNKVGKIAYTTSCLRINGEVRI